MDALGNVTTYTYNANTNVMQSVQSLRDAPSNRANNIVYRTVAVRNTGKPQIYIPVFYMQTLAYSNGDSVQ